MSQGPINRLTLRSFVVEAEILLAEIGERYGVSVCVKNGSFQPDGSAASLRLELVTKLSEEQKEAKGLTDVPDKFRKEASDFTARAFLYGLKPEYLGQTFCSRGKTYRVIGLKPNSPKYPVLVQQGGQVYKLSDREVKVAFEAQQAPSVGV
jgi:hypothetical protein